MLEVVYQSSPVLTALNWAGGLVLLDIALRNIENFKLRPRDWLSWLFMGAWVALGAAAGGALVQPFIGAPPPLLPDVLNILGTCLLVGAYAAKKRRDNRKLGDSTLFGGGL